MVETILPIGLGILSAVLIIVGLNFVWLNQKDFFRLFESS